MGHTQVLAPQFQNIQELDDVIEDEDFVQDQEMEDLDDDEGDADGGFHQELQQNNTQN